MDIYHYHPISGEFLYQGTAEADPLDAGSWLIPAHATMLAPPAETGKAAVWSEGGWTLVDDHRGETWFSGYGRPVEIAALGVPVGLTATEPDPSPADLHAHLAAIRRAHETGGVTVTVGPDVIEVATDQEGRTNLLGARVAAQEVPGFATVWSALNGRFALDATGIIALSDAVLAHINGAFVAQDVVAEDIDAGTLTTPAEVEAAFAAAVAAV